MIPVWFLLSSLASAAEVTIDPAGEPATLQAAVDLANSGDTIVVPAGTLSGCASLGGKDLDIVGAGAGQSTLDGAGCAELLRARAGERLGVAGLTLTNDGGRCIAVLGGTLTVTDSTLTGCGAAATDGAGIWARAADTTLSAVELRDNEGLTGAAVLAWDGGSLAVRDCHFEGNLAAEQGAAIYGNGDVDGLIEDTDFIGNAAPERVGGAVAWHEGSLSIARAEFIGNEAMLFGGALYPHHVAEGVVLEDVRFEDNRSTAGDGGAIATAFGTVLLARRVVFEDNAARDGGAVWASGGSITTEDTSFRGNAATDRGGALLATADAAVSVTATGLCGNTAETGGALHLDGGRHRLEQTWLARNAAVAEGGAIRADGADLSLGWTTTVGTAAPAGAAIAVTGGGLELHSSLVAHSDGVGVHVEAGASTAGGTNAWWDNAGGDTTGEADAPTAEDVLADPALLAWGDDTACADLDLRLQRGSPLVDAGRPDAVDPDGSRADIGAWGGPTARWTDEDGDGDAYPVDCDDTAPDIGPDCTEREEAPTDTATPDTAAPEGRETAAKPAGDGGCKGGVGLLLLPLLLLGRRRRR